MMIRKAGPETKVKKRGAVDIIRLIFHQ